MGIVPGERDDERGGWFRKAVAQAVILGTEHLGDALDRRRFIGSRLGGGPGTEHGHVAQFRGSGDGFRGGVHRQFARVHLGKKKYSHYRTPASSLSFVISSSTEATLTPAARASGSEVVTTCRRGVTSTP
mmetsp:Transcript_3534/g.6362  ORF Transcript_3534/g.6362 Transcript_3534/m.6362 type:complete len:130 (+) Transcript_3534:742-1131(+)